MKKKLILIFTLIFIMSLSAISSFAEDTVMSKVSFDTVGYTPAGGAEVTFKDGGADIWLEENPQSFEAGAWDSVYLRGWAGDAAEIATFGYKIDDGAFVAGEFKQATEAGVLGAGGEHASRFKVVVPVKTLGSGEHVVTVFAKLADDSVLKVASFPFTVTGGAGSENPGTGSYAAITIVFALVAVSMVLVLTKKRSTI